jgi:hypothetical protein
VQTRQAGGIGSGLGEARAQKVVTGAADNDNAPVVMMTRAELKALVREAAEEARVLAASNPGCALLDRNAIAAALGCSATTIDSLRKRGMPWVRLGESPRFELEDCLSWLRGQKGAE